MDKIVGSRLGQVFATRYEPDQIRMIKKMKKGQRIFCEVEQFLHSGQLFDLDQAKERTARLEHAAA